MKRYSLIIMGALLALAGNLHAQAPRVYTVPAAFDVNEDVTLYLDVTGTALDGVSGTMCLWSWSDSGDNKNNGGWGTFGNILTKVGDNLYSATINMGKDYPAGATEIQGLVVTQDGSAQTDDSDAVKPFDFTKLAGVNGVIYPAAFNAATPVSIMININNSGNIDPSTAAVHMHAGLNNWGNVVEYDSDRNKTALSKVEGYDGVWRINLVPSEYFGVPENEKIINIMAVFNNGTWDQKMDDGGSDFAFVPKVAEDGPQAARFFLSQFTLDDVLPVIVNTTGFTQEVKDAESGEVTTPGDPLYGYNGASMVFTITLSNGDKEVKKQIAAPKTADNTYMVVLLPSRQFGDISDATDIEVAFSAEGKKSTATLKGSFVK